MNRELFGKTTDGKEIYRYWMENSKGMKAGVINYGAILVNLLVPDKDGNTVDVVLGYDTLEEYVEKGNFFGATVGPNANRIGGASFELEGKRYQLDANDGKNNLHSHLTQGYHMRVWEATQDKESVTFFLEDADGNMGFPGNKKVWVTYTLTEENELKIHYQAKSDKNTIINMTNHSYFNLAGHDQGAVYDHILKLKASNYTPIVMGAIPTDVEIRRLLGLKSGDKVLFFQKQDGEIVVSNASAQAIRKAQAAFARAAEDIGAANEDDVQALVDEVRYGRDA